MSESLQNNRCNATCHCGRPYFKYKSTQSECPSCAYKTAFDKQSEKQKAKSTAPWNRGRKSPKNASGDSRPRKKSEHTKAKERAWAWVSRYIRLKYSRNGVCWCYTCGEPHSIKNIDGGHFISRSSAATVYHEDNIRPQDMSCNRFRQGEHAKFRDHLLEEIGKERVEALEALARTRGDDSIAYHNSIEKEYKAKVMELQERLGVKYW